MAQANVATQTGATYVGEESTFGTLASSMLRAFPNAPISPSLNQTQIANADERVRLGSHIAPSLGLKTGSIPLPVYLKPGTQLTSGATPADHYLALLMRCAWGGHDATAGSTVASGSTSSVTVGAGHGSRFKIGGWIAVETGASGGTLEPCRVTNISTDTLTLYPSLSASPYATGRVVNGETFYWTDTNTKSVSVQHAKAQANTTARYTMLGGRVGLALAVPRDGMLQATFTVNFADWSQPGSDAVSVADASDAIGACFVGKSMTTLLQTPATTTRTHYPLHSVEPSFINDMGLTHLMELGGVQGMTGVMRTAGRPIGNVKIAHRFDSQIQTWYEAQTPVGLIVIIPQGSGTSQRFVVLDFPNLVFTPQPSHGDSNGHWAITSTLEAMEDSTTTTSGLSGTNLDRAVSAIRMAII